MEEVIDLSFVALVFGLFVLPRYLERWHIPAGITAFGLGLAAASCCQAFRFDQLLGFLAVLGISSLFLLAGIEADLSELKKVWRFLAVHVAGTLGVLALITTAALQLFDLPFNVAGLLALALATPSTGFILDAIPSLPLSEEQRFWVKSKAIGTELVALLIMFFLLQSHSLEKLSLSALGLFLIIAVLPLVFMGFAKIVSPHAKNSEFSFFIVLAVLVGIATKRLGTYYLVGAFIVGLAVQRFEDLFEVMNAHKVYDALKLFCTFFVPFYFYRAGNRLSLDVFSTEALTGGLALTLIIVPLRLLPVFIQRRMQFRESFKQILTVGISITPTLVFGLVIAEILRTRYNLAPDIFGALVTYTILVTIIPGFILRNSRFQDIPEPHEVF
ncbi:MAG TPA: cation:proton antiporter [Oligoflexus sp.]|uniref:cation:proton antiporter n=1 Tax=Oligoflexus sp. TaxID=1971216 RepID=UPI002D2CE1D3|nr:cation:proton antiporter [Oligoflexus sp.]HYX34544.1 cation:proton antiporter [Oligoflexus sp.]